MIGGQAGNRLPKTREISWVVGFLGGALVSHLAQSAGVTYGCHSVLLRRRDRRLCLVARAWLLWFMFGVLFAPCLCWFAIR